jgi:hypothetical protein
MGEREMLLAMAAILFFSMTTMTIDRFCLNNSEVMMESEFIYYATSLAQKIIEEAKTKAFDQTVVSNPATNPPYSFSMFGPGPGESYPNFTDVDDYNGLNLPVTATVNGPKVNYTVRVRVGYVEESDLNTIVTHNTFHKKMIVTVASDYLPAPVKLSYVFSYFEY